MSRTYLALTLGCLALAGCRANRADDARAPEPAPPAGDAPAEEAPERAEAPAETTGPDLAAIRYRALGNEPFWGVEVTMDSLVLERPAEDPRVFRVDELRRRPGTDVVVGSDEAGSITVTIRRERCSDGMSDREYAFASTVALDGETFTGCAFEKEFLVREVGVDPVDEVGLGPAVDAARAIRDRQGEYARVVGRLDRPDADAAFAGHFDDGEVRMIEYRLRKGDDVLEEASFYFFGDPGPGGTDVLADGEAWAAGSGGYTWYLFGYRRDGAVTGSRVEHGDGEGADVPAGMPAAKHALAMELKAAAERELAAD